MRSLLGLLALALALPAAAQPLTCPPVAAAAGRPCELFHFHVAMYRPDTRGFVELTGLNDFASQPACERARDAQFRRNAAVAEFFRTQRRDESWQPDRFGLCHCDMTVESSSPNYLTDAQRLQQVRLADEIRQRVRERLLDAQIASDSELVRGLITPSQPASVLGAPKLVAIPAPAAAATQTNAPEDLRLTKAVDSGPQQSASLDLPLAEVVLPGMPAAPAPETAAAVPTPAPAPAPVQVTESAPAQTPPAAQPAPAPAPQPAPAPVPAAVALEATAPPATVVADEPEPPAADDVADAFVSYESQRIQNVLKVSGSIGDEAVKARVLEACTQRIQLLANLRSLIVGSGAKSRLVAAAHNATTEPARMALIGKLFGSDVPAHWAPNEAENVVFDPGVADPEKVLRDPATSTQDKKHALYALLATGSPTEQQQLSLTALIDSFLR